MEMFRAQCFTPNFSFKENILVLDGDRFIEDPVAVLKTVEKFLDIPSFYTAQHFTYNGWFLHLNLRGNKNIC